MTSTISVVPEKKLCFQNVERYSDFGRILSPNDVGKLFVRTFPHRYSNGIDDYSFMPRIPVVKYIHRSAVKIEQVSKEFLVASRKGNPKKEIFTLTGWNDGYWIPLEDFLKISKK